MSTSRPSLMAFLQFRTAMGAFLAMPAAIFSAAASSTSCAVFTTLPSASVSAEYTSFTSPMRYASGALILRAV